MERLIQETIKKLLAEEILFRKLAKGGGEAFIDIKENKITISYKEHSPREKVLN